MRRLTPIVVLMLLISACGRTPVDGTPPIGCELTYDTGVHIFENKPIVLSHTFTVRNTGARTLKIVKTASTCGCTTAKARTEKIDAGGLLEVDVAVTVQSAGVRREGVSVVLDDGSIQSFAMQITIQARAEVFPAVGAVTFDAGGNATVPLIAFTEGLHISPAPPEIRASSGVVCSFSGWRPGLQFAREYDGEYARWCASIELHAPTGTVIAPSDFLQVTLADTNVATFSLVGRYGPPPRK